MSEYDSEHIPDEPVIPEEILDDEAIALFFSDLHSERLKKAGDIKHFGLPKLSSVEIKTAYGRIRQAEQKLVAPNLTKKDYRYGTAKHNDEIAIFSGRNPILFTAEHATMHYRTDSAGHRKRKAQDLGTAGLAYVLSQDFDGFFMTMLGRQTGDANFQEQHPFKLAMEEAIAANGINTVVTLHGMASGKFKDFADKRAYDVLLGIGPRPNEATLKLAEMIEQTASYLDLRCSTNEWFVKVVEDDPLIPERNPDGTIAFQTFVSPYYTTRSMAQSIGEKYGLNMAAVQVELSDLLRFILPEVKPRSLRTRMVGTYLGYLLIQSSLESAVSSLTSRPPNDG